MNEALGSCSSVCSYLIYVVIMPDFGFFSNFMKEFSRALIQIRETFEQKKRTKGGGVAKRA